MAQWLWRLQSDSLGWSPTAASFSLFSFLPEQVEFHLNLRVCSVMLYNLSLYSISSYHIVLRLSITVYLKYNIQFVREAYKKVGPEKKLQNYTCAYERIDAM